MKKGEARNYFYFALPVLVISIALFALNINKMSSVLLFPHSTDYAEAIAFFTPATNLYANFSTYPFVLTYYPPLYYVVLDVSRSLLSGLSPYVLARILNLIAAIIDLPLLYFLCRKSLKQSVFSSLLAVCMLGGSFVFMINALDLPLFELIFDLAALIFLFSKVKRASVYAALLLAVAVFFRQSALLLAPGVLLYLFFAGKRKDALFFAVTFLAAVAIPTLLLNAATQGRFIFSVFTLPLITPFIAGQLQNFLNNFLLTTPFLVLLAVLFYYAYKFEMSPLFWIVIFSFVSVASSGKYGGSYVYFLVPFALLCASAAPYIESLLAYNLEEKPKKLAYYAVVLLVIAGFLIPALYSSNNTLSFSPQPETPIMGNALSSFPGNILVETPSLALDANKTMEFEPRLFWVMQQNGLWNDSLLIAGVNSHRFSAIVFQIYGKFDMYPGLENAINTSYQKDYSIQSWEVYVPKNATK